MHHIMKALKKTVKKRKEKRHDSRLSHSSHVRLRINEVELTNVDAFKRPVFHASALEFAFGQVEMEEVETILGL